MKRPLDLPNRRGFTLVELLVAMALMTIISTILATFMVSAQRMYDVSVAQSNVISNARTALDIIGRDLDNITPLDAQIPTSFDQRGVQNRRVEMGESDPNPTGRGLALTLRSLGYESDRNNWGTPAEDVRFVAWPMGGPDPGNGSPPENEIENRSFLSFYATTTTVIGGAGGQPDRVERRPVRVVYYLLARPRDTDNRIQPGAYLVRRIYAYEWNYAGGNWTCNWNATTPSDEDICSFVRGVEVRYMDRTLTPAPGAEMVFVEASPTPRVGPVPPSAGARPLMEGNPPRVRFCLDPDWWEFRASQPFTQKDFLPPAIEISLFLCDNTGLTTREIKRVYTFPTSPLVIPPKPRAD